MPKDHCSCRLNTEEKKIATDRFHKYLPFIKLLALTVLASWLASTLKFNFFFSANIVLSLLLVVKLFGLARFRPIFFCFYRVLAKMTAVKSIDTHTAGLPFEFRHQRSLAASKLVMIVFNVEKRMLNTCKGVDYRRKQNKN